MTILVYFNFDDKHSIDDYGMVNPSEKLIHEFNGNKLIVRGENSITVAFGVDFGNFEVEKEVTVTLKNAKGNLVIDGYNGTDIWINRPESKDVTGKIKVRKDSGRRGDLIFILVPNKDGNSYFEFTGYKIEI